MFRACVCRACVSRVCVARMYRTYVSRVGVARVCRACLCVARSLLRSQHMSLLRSQQQAISLPRRRKPSGAQRAHAAIPLRCTACRIASPRDPASSSLSQVSGPHCALAGHCSSHRTFVPSVLRDQDTPRHPFDRRPPSLRPPRSPPCVCFARVCVFVARVCVSRTSCRPRRRATR